MIRQVLLKDISMSFLFCLESQAYLPDYKAMKPSVDITSPAIKFAMYIHFYSKMWYHATRAASESLLIELHIYVGISRCEN